VSADVFERLDGIVEGSDTTGEGSDWIIECLNGANEGLDAGVEGLHGAREGLDEAVEWLKMIAKGRNTTANDSFLVAVSSAPLPASMDLCGAVHRRGTAFCVEGARRPVSPFSASGQGEHHGRRS